MIAEAAYYIAARRGFAGQHSLADWLEAELQVRNEMSPRVDGGTMSSTTDQTIDETEQAGDISRIRPAAAAATQEASTPPSSPVIDETEQAGDRSHRRAPRRQQSESQYEKFAATQAAGDGIEGDVLKHDKTVDEKLGAQMADRK